MPYDWVAPEVALEHRGVTIWHAYKDDQRQNPPRKFWFVADELAHEDDAFDIREWPDYKEDETPKDNVRWAIVKKDLTQEGPNW